MISSPIAWPNGLFHLRALLQYSLNILSKLESEKGNHKDQGGPTWLLSPSTHLAQEETVSKVRSLTLHY